MPVKQIFGLVSPHENERFDPSMDFSKIKWRQWVKSIAHKSWPLKFIREKTVPMPYTRLLSTTCWNYGGTNFVMTTGDIPYNDKFCPVLEWLVNVRRFSNK